MIAHHACEDRNNHVEGLEMIIFQKNSFKFIKELLIPDQKKIVCYIQWVSGLLLKFILSGKSHFPVNSHAELHRQMSLLKYMDPLLPPREDLVIRSRKLTKNSTPTQMYFELRLDISTGVAKDRL